MSNDTQAVQKADNGSQQALQSVGAGQIRHQVNQIQEIMREVMQEDEHYGKIPGTGDKKTLLKAGAEKLGFSFRLSPDYEIERTDLGDGHREYEVLCRLVHINSGQEVGQGVGLCSTMESKYRYRYEEKSTGVPVPKDYWDDRTPDKLREAAHVDEDVDVGTSKIGGAWMIVTKRKAENPVIADTYNTVLKMAKKRAHVDAVLTATAASDIFTQDVEDFEHMGGEVVVEEAETDSTQGNDRPQPPPQERPQQAQQSNGGTVQATEKQLAFIGALRSQKGVDKDFLKDLAENVCGKRDAQELTKDEASELIDELQDLPDQDEQD